MKFIYCNFLRFSKVKFILLMITLLISCNAVNKKTTKIKEPSGNKDNDSHNNKESENASNCLHLAKDYNLTTTSYFYDRSSYNNLFDDIINSSNEKELFKKNDIVTASKTGDSWILSFNNIPEETQIIEIKWLYEEDAMPFIYYELTSTENFKTQPFNFENIPLLQINLIKKQSVIRHTFAKYLVDLENL